ncbi:MAG: Asp23/Gls24 family envelope stress response protein [Thomasclavelia sp.]|nr:Asp23/Gls24 family envelope stress response protein [Thomasclavelia sp.]
MSTEYYQIQKENNYGNQFISTKSFSSIAIHVMKDKKGIDFEGGSLDMIPGTKGPLSVKINDNNQIIILMDVVIDYGINVNKIVEELQTAILNEISAMIDIRNVKINVNVKNINF